MGELVSKISNGGGGGRVRATALRTLDALVHSGVSDLRHYALFLTQFLDHVDALDLVEVRQVMDILAYLAYVKPEEAGMLPDNIQIVVKKQARRKSKTKWGR